jgi:hypothetical protein
MFPNHSVAILIVDGQAYMLHGGITRMAYRVGAGRPTATLTADWLRQFNRFTIYGAAEGLTDDALRAQIAFWNQMNTGLRNRSLNVLMAEGCSGSQAMLLERLAVHRAGAGERLLPFLMDRSRAAAGVGTSYVTRPWGWLGGTAMQGTLYGAAGIAYAAPTTVRMLGRPPSAGFFAQNVLPEQREVMVVRSIDNFDLGFNWLEAPPESIGFPDAMTFADGNPLALRAAFYARPVGGGPPDGVIWDEATQTCRPAPAFSW